jgi:hypothetical protein
MKNKILFLTRNTVPYVKELHSITGSVVGCLLMQQLDYWFERRENGYYKFLEPVEHEKYQPGGSWTEELGFSKDEFRTGFDRIGIRYKSKTEFLTAQATGDVFQGKFYCSYTDRQTYLTWYFRNHELLDATLDQLISGDNIKLKTPQKVVSVNQESQSTVNQESQSTVNQESQSALYKETEITLQRLHTTEVTNTTACEFDSTISEPNLKPENRVCMDLIFPKSISPPEQSSLRTILSKHPCPDPQAILDELDGALAAGACKNVVALAMALTKAAAQGEFYPSLGVAVAQNRAKSVARIARAAGPPQVLEIDEAACQKGLELIEAAKIRRQSRLNLEG